MQGYIRHGDTTFASLTKQQKESILLLLIGTFAIGYLSKTFLVYGMLLINSNIDMVFQLPIPFLVSIFFFIPIGPVIWCYIGDYWGRKSIVVTTTLVVAISSFTMTILPTYAEIGNIAIAITTICITLVFIFTIGDEIGTALYLTESVAPPAQYPAVALMIVFGAVGQMFASAVAFLITPTPLNWRYAFWISSGIMMIGVIARTYLRETVEFADAKRYIADTVEKANIDTKKLQDNTIVYAKVNMLTLLALVAIQCAQGARYFLSQCVYLNDYTSEMFIQESFAFSVISLVGAIILPVLSYYIYPLKILKVQAAISLTLILVYHYLLGHAASEFQMRLIISFISLFSLADNVAWPIFYKHFPVLKRCTMIYLSLALSTITVIIAAIMIAIIIAIIAVLLLTDFSNTIPVIISILTTIVFILGLLHFEKLEKATIKNSKDN